MELEAAELLVSATEGSLGEAGGDCLEREEAEEDRDEVVDVDEDDFGIDFDDCDDDDDEELWDLDGSGSVLVGVSMSTTGCTIFGVNSAIMVTSGRGIGSISVGNWMDPARRSFRGEAGGDTEVSGGTLGDGGSETSVAGGVGSELGADVDSIAWMGSTDAVSPSFFEGSITTAVFSDPFDGLADADSDEDEEGEDEDEDEDEDEEADEEEDEEDFSDVASSPVGAGFAVAARVEF